MRSKFDNELKQLEQQLIEMGSLIETAIKYASDALINNNITLTDEAINYEKLIDLKEREIETLCLKLMVEQQPVASDFRSISAALKMITDMERIGDHAEDISEITKFLLDSDTSYINKEVHANLESMSKNTINMIQQSINAFINKDLSEAEKVVEHDDIVDDLFFRVKENLIDFITIDKSNAIYGLDLLMIAKYYERIGDHAVNIAEWVIYKITGEHKSLD